MPAIQTDSLTKSYGDKRAIDDVTVSVEEGEIFGFLGPNGAGKSTTMMILTTLLRPTSGSARVAGHDVVSSPKEVRDSIGYIPQDPAVDEFLTGRDNLVLQARLSRIPGAVRDRRIDEMLDIVELGERAGDAAVTYSGGMRKRLDIAGGLLHRPKILFLDEPTVGLDIQTRRKIWGYIRRMHREFGMTVFLSTHYMEEADSLCDRIGIIDAGRIRTIDSPSSLKSVLGGEVVTLRAGGARASELASRIGALPGVGEISEDSGQITAYVQEGRSAIPRIFAESAGLGIRIESISLKQPTLDDVFISYTGHELRDGSGEHGYDRHKAYRRTREMRM